MDDLIAFLNARYGEEERMAHAAQRDEPTPWQAYGDDVDAGVVTEDGGTIRDGDGNMRMTVAQHIAHWNPARVLDEIDAKRKRLAWLLELAHEAGDEEFPTWESCRLLWTEDMRGDEEIGYCSCGLDARRNQLFRFDALPYADHPYYRDEWRP